MSNKFTPYIIGAVLLVLVLLFFLTRSSSEPNYSWKEHYKPESKDPYGTYLVRNLLESYFPDQGFEVVRDSLNECLDSGSYVYIGDRFWLDSVALSQLLNFVDKGNQVFIACTYLPQNLMDTLSSMACGRAVEDSLAEDDYDEVPFFDGNLYHVSDSVVIANFQHPSLADEKGYEFRRLFLKQSLLYEWAFVPEEVFCEGQTTLTSLGQINGEHTNFMSVAFGKGQFLLHTTPIAFTNLHLLKKKGLDYASKSFSHLKKGKIYWDERPYNPFANYAGGGGDSGPKESPLKYILSQPALAWAWYILLGMAVTYLIFRAKRRQRVIPVLEKNTNTSLEFIGTIGRLFFLQNNHRQLAAQKMRLFLIFVREHYRMPTKDLNEQFAKSLAIRSNVSEDLITKIIYINYNIERSGTITEELLVDFHRMMEKFYRECK